MRSRSFFVIFIILSESFTSQETAERKERHPDNYNLRYEVTEIPDESPPGKNSSNLRWMLLPDGRDNVQPAIISGLRSDAAPDVQKVQFLLYTKDNPERPEIRIMNDSCAPVFKYFRSKRKTKYIIHGFGDNAKESYMIPALKDAFLSRGNFNIMVVDWSELSSKPWYVSAADNTDPVGKHVARFIDHMSESTGSKTLDIHMVGFSLGAHVAGMTGKYTRSGRIRHITGLDPAVVLFSSSGPDKRLDSSHAELVEIVHTSGGYIGFEKAIGHRDFYPNGGFWPQPGCIVDYAAVCSHRRAYYYYAEALKNADGFEGVRCESYDYYLNNKCPPRNNAVLQMGRFNYNKKMKGAYFLNTNGKEPFAQKAPKNDSEETDNFIEIDDFIA